MFARDNREKYRCRAADQFTNPFQHALVFRGRFELFLETFVAGDFHVSAPRGFAEKHRSADEQVNTPATIATRSAERYCVGSLPIRVKHSRCRCLRWIHPEGLSGLGGHVCPSAPFWVQNRTARWDGALS